MKIFISHKKEDEYAATRIANELRLLGVGFYLDVMDNNTTGSGKELTDHIRENLNDCTDIIVIMSNQTRYSQWVPFEVGMSAQLNMPTATFLEENVYLPEFLEFWPRLKYPSDIRKYVSVRRRYNFQRRSHFDSLEFASQRESNLATFYSALKRELR